MIPFDFSLMLKCFAVAASIPRLRLVEAPLMLIYSVHVDVIIGFLLFVVL